jgi:hypothetical protein
VVIKLTDKRPMLNIAGIAEKNLDKKKKKNFLDFYGFLNEHALGTRKVVNRWEIRWSITCTGKKIGAFHVHDDSWSVSFFHLFHTKKWFDYCDKYLTDEMKEFILANINTTSNCCVKGICQSVENATILGKSFNRRVCACVPFIINNPNGKTLLYAKELTKMCKDIFSDWLNMV